MTPASTPPHFDGVDYEDTDGLASSSRILFREGPVKDNNYAASTTSTKTMMITQEEHEDEQSPPSSRTPSPILSEIPKQQHRQQPPNEQPEQVVVATPLRRSPRKRKSLLSQDETTTAAASATISQQRQSPLRRSPRKSLPISATMTVDDMTVGTVGITSAVASPMKTVTTPTNKKKLRTNNGTPHYSRKPLQQQSPHDKENANATRTTNGIVLSKPAPAKATTITTAQLEGQMALLFPNANTNEMPCVASRLFACFALVGDNANSVESILPLLNSLVNLEMVLLRDGQDERRVPLDSSDNGQQPRKKRVHFAAFDGSAMQPPSDVMEGSYKAQEECILHLTKVKETGIQTIRSDPAVKCLRSLAEYLKKDFASCHALVANSLSQTRGGAFAFPVRRVAKAAISYASDLEHLANAEETQWEYRLADALAQLVRYWLRTVLNPVPDRAPMECSSQAWNSRVCESLTLESDLDHVAIDDGSLSSLVSDALSNIYHYVGSDTNLWEARLAFPTSFCQSSLCLRGIRKDNQYGFTNEEWKTLGCHIQTAIGFLAAGSSAEFLHQLLTIVASYPSTHLKAWETTIQKSGSQLGSVDCLQPQDEHLVLLGSMDVADLIQVLETTFLTSFQRQRQESCKRNLLAMGKRYALQEPKHNKTNRRKSTSSRFQQFRNNLPQVAKLQDYWERSMRTLDFPTVLAKDDEEDW